MYASGITRMCDCQHMQVLVETHVYQGIHETLSGSSQFTSEIDIVIDIAKFIDL